MWAITRREIGGVVLGLSLICAGMAVRADDPVDVLDAVLDARDVAEANDVAVRIGYDSADDTNAVTVRTAGTSTAATDDDKGSHATQKHSNSAHEERDA